MRFLVVNDDGVKSTGLKFLVEKLLEFSSDIMVVAPFEEMSATSHRLSLREGLNINREFDIIEGVPTYSVTGTPADCVKVAIDHLKYIPDIVFSGVNNGFNMGNDIIYSGTVAGASEASFYNICGIAVSCKRNCLDGINYFDEVMHYVFDNGLIEKGRIININIPPKPKGIRFTHQGSYPFKTEYVLKENGLYYVESTPIGMFVENDEETDVYNVLHDFVSIGFLTIDRTNHELFNKYKNTKFNF